MSGCEEDGKQFHASILRKLKADDKRQMVAKATLIAITIKRTEGFYSSVFFVFFQQERSIVDIGLLDIVQQNRTDKDMVNTLPEALITVGTLSTMSSFDVTSNMMQTILNEILQGRTVRIVIEVSRHNDLGIRGQLTNRSQQALGDNPTIGTCLPFTTKATGSVNHKDV